MFLDANKQSQTKLYILDQVQRWRLLTAQMHVDQWHCLHILNSQIFMCLYIILKTSACPLHRCGFQGASELMLLLPRTSLHLMLPPTPSLTLILGNVIYRRAQFKKKYADRIIEENKQINSSEYLFLSDEKALFNVKREI